MVDLKFIDWVNGERYLGKKIAGTRVLAKVLEIVFGTGCYVESMGMTCVARLLDLTDAWFTIV